MAKIVTERRIYYTVSGGYMPTLTLSNKKAANQALKRRVEIENKVKNLSKFGKKILSR
jgi:hypothetical protein